MPAQTQQPAAPAAPKPPAPPPPPPMVDSQYGTPEQIMELPAARLIAILRDPAASEYAKAKACQKLAVVGDKRAVPALAALLTDVHIGHYARFGLEPIPGPAADDALRAALGQVQGPLLVGVINSIGIRRDPKAMSALAKLRFDSDQQVAAAANAAIARIRPPF